MSPELDQALCKDFPLLFASRHGNLMQTAMCWGFECGDGWAALLRRGAERLEPLIKALASSADYTPKATQVKEKYGALRFYMSSETDEMSAIIRVMERESEITCEECGSAGSAASTSGTWGGWIKTVCDTHLDNNYKRVKKEE